jgi:serine/threonine protein kinase
MRSYSTNSLRDKYPYFGPVYPVKKFRAEKKTEDDTKTESESSDDESEVDEQAEERFENKVISFVVSRLSSTYHFISLINRNSNKVYLVFYEGKRYVLKINMFESESRKPEEIEIMEKLVGVQRVQQLIRWHIIDVIEYGIKCYALLTPYYEESDYDHLKKDKKLIKQYMKNLLEVLVEMHKRSIIYRDVKHSNVMWNKKTNDIVFIDFDCSLLLKNENKEQREYSVTGTDGFMAPEITSGKYDYKVDIWSAGVLFGCLLHGIDEGEIKEKDINNWLEKIKNKKHYNLNSEEDLLKKMLTTTASKRPTAEALLKHKYFY